MLAIAVPCICACLWVCGCDIVTNTTTANSAMIVTLPEPINLRSLRGDTPTALTFVNELNISVTVNWIDYNGQEVYYATLQPSQAYTQQTFDTHPWIVRETAHRAPVKIVIATPEQTVVKIRPASVSSSTY
jgi:hypothetical protein